MLHLPTERLAELADREPTDDELAHLSACAECAHERSAFRAVRANALAMRDRIAPPLTSWAPIAQQLRSEGIIAARTGWRPSRGWMEAAAGIIIAAAGLGLGRLSMHAAPAEGTSVAVISGDRGLGAVTVASSSGSGSSGTGVSYSTTSSPTPLAGTFPTHFDSRGDALSAMARAQDTYQRAAAYLAGEDSSTMDEASYRTRLAALDEMSATARAAMYQAPQDPVINQYYLATLGAREATLRQIGARTPVASNVTRF